MTKDSRAEILIVAGVALLLLFFWHRNAATQGTGLTATILPPVEGNPVTNGGVPLDLTMPTGYAAGATLPGITAPAIDIGGSTFNFANPTACGCGGGAHGGPTYGSASDLAAGLLSQGYDQPFVTPGSVF